MCHREDEVCWCATERYWFESEVCVCGYVLTGIGLEMVLRVMRNCPMVPHHATAASTTLPSTAEGERRKAAGNT